MAVSVQRSLRVQRNMRMLRNYQLYLMVLPALVYFLVFCYAPMYGIQIAFKDFRIKSGITGSEWAGLKYFNRFWGTPNFYALIRNTLRISIYSLVVGFPFPILLALVINEIRSNRFKRIVQTVSYAPHFISTVVMVSMLTIFLNPGYGMINKLIGIFGLGPYNFMTKANWFSSIYVISGIWQSAGWSSIIYLSALSGVDPELHDAAMIDGASRIKRIIHINIPGILPTVTIMFIMAAGNLMSVGFEKVYLMQNPLNTEASEIISTYVYKMGLQNAQYSFSTAVGLFNSLINFVLLLSVNLICRRLGETSLW